MTSAPTNEFSTVEDKIEVAEGKKADADKAFRDGNWQGGELQLLGKYGRPPVALQRSANCL